jgi:hypothetical protein
MINFTKGALELKTFPRCVALSGKGSVFYNTNPLCAKGTLVCDSNKSLILNKSLRWQILRHDLNPLEEMEFAPFMIPEPIRDITRL